MKEIILKIILISILFILTIILFWNIPGNYNQPLAAIINKIDMLKNPTNDRIILLGGSGLYCGIDSEKMEKELKKNVVNLGLWVGFSVNFILKEIEPYVKKGDRIILILEYGSFNTSSILTMNEQEKKWALALHPKLNFNNIPFEVFNFIMLIKLKLQAFFISILTFNWSNVFSEGLLFYNHNFTKHGDGIGHLFDQTDKKEMEGYKKKLANLDISEKAFISINNMYHSLKNKGVDMFFIFPAYPDEEYINNKDEIDVYYQKLVKYLKMPIIGVPSNYIFSYNYFSNSVNHLNKEGKILRTQKLIESLKEKFKN